MRQSEREILHGLMACRAEIPYPKEINTSPIVGYQSYTQDMKTFNKASHELVMALLCPDLVGDGYAPPKKILQGIREWIERRKAVAWEFDRDDIVYAGAYTEGEDD